MEPDEADAVRIQSSLSLLRAKQARAAARQLLLHQKQSAAAASAATDSPSALPARLTRAATGPTITAATRDDADFATNNTGQSHAPTALLSNMAQYLASVREKQAASESSHHSRGHSMAPPAAAAATSHTERTFTRRHSEVAHRNAGVIGAVSVAGGGLLVSPSRRRSIAVATNRATSNQSSPHTGPLVSPRSPSLASLASSKSVAYPRFHYDDDDEEEEDGGPSARSSISTSIAASSRTAADEADIDLLELDMNGRHDATSTSRSRAVPEGVTSEEDVSPVGVAAETTRSISSSRSSAHHSSLRISVPAIHGAPPSTAPAMNGAASHVSPRLLPRGPTSAGASGLASGGIGSSIWIGSAAAAGASVVSPRGSGGIGSAAAASVISVTTTGSSPLGARSLFSPPGFAAPSPTLQIYAGSPVSASPLCSPFASPPPLLTALSPTAHTRAVAGAASAALPPRPTMHLQHAASLLTTGDVEHTPPSSGPLASTEYPSPSPTPLHVVGSPRGATSASASPLLWHGATPFAAAIPPLARSISEMTLSAQPPPSATAGISLISEDGTVRLEQSTSPPILAHMRAASATNTDETTHAGEQPLPSAAHTVHTLGARNGHAATTATAVPPERANDPPSVGPLPTPAIPPSSILRRPFRPSIDAQAQNDESLQGEADADVTPNDVSPASLLRRALVNTAAAAATADADPESLMTVSANSTATAPAPTPTPMSARRPQAPLRRAHSAVVVPSSAKVLSPRSPLVRPAAPPHAAAPPPLVEPLPTHAARHELGDTIALPPSAPFVHRIFDHFLVLGCSPSPSLLSQHLPAWTEPPKVLLKFPHHSPVEAADVADFAFPADVHLARVDTAASSSGLHSILYGAKQFHRGANCHVFLLKTTHRVVDPNEPEDLYGICVSARELASLTDSSGVVHDVSCPITYCLLSRYPFFDLHQAVIHQILMLLHLKRVKHLGQLADAPDIVTRLRGKPLGPHQVPACVALLKKYYETPVPNLGGSIVIPAPRLLLPIEFHRPSSRGGEIHALLSQWATPLAWCRLTADTLVDLLEFALREMKIVVVDDNLAMLSAAVYAIAPMLRPLKWSGVFLPVLPNKLCEFLEAPVPIIAGVATLPRAFDGGGGTVLSPDTETVVWLPSSGRFVLPRGLKRLLPCRAALVAALKPHFSELRRLHPLPSPARTTPDQLPYTPSVEVHAHCKIALHLVETELVYLVNYVRTTEDAAATRDRKMEPFIERFRETQMLSHYLQTHEHDEEDY